MLKVILVPLDGSALGEQALPIATRLATATGAKLVLIQSTRAYGVASPTLDEIQARLTQDSQDYLAPLAQRVRNQGIVVETFVVGETAEEGILLEIDLREADLVVMTTHGRSGIGRWIYGSVAESVLRQSPVPILLVRASTTETASPLDVDHPRIVVPLDGSFFAEAALPIAAELARATGGALTLLRAIIPPSSLAPSRMVTSEYVTEMVELSIQRAEDYLTAQAEALAQTGLTVEKVIRVGSAAEAILEESKNASLIAMTTHGRTGLARLLAGSVAMEVLRRGSLPVLVVRPSELFDEQDFEKSPALHKEAH